MQNFCSALGKPWALHRGKNVFMAFFSLLIVFIQDESEGVEYVESAIEVGLGSAVLGLIILGRF